MTAGSSPSASRYRRAPGAGHPGPYREHSPHRVCSRGGPARYRQEGVRRQRLFRRGEPARYRQGGVRRQRLLRRERSRPARRRQGGVRLHRRERSR